MQLHSCIRYQVLHITWTVIFNIIMITTLAIFLSYVKTQAQDALNFQPMVPAQIAKPSTTADGGLQIGNAIPDELWDMPLQVVNHPQGKETITLAEYKDKLIILDFWGTACGTCITSLYKLDTLQSQLADDLAVIPVAVERADPVKKAVEHYGWDLPSVVSGGKLKEYFPHRMIPQYVWIKDNQVRGITRHADATIDNIMEVMKDENFTMQTKKDIMDYSNHVNLSIYADRTAAPIFLSSVATGRIPGVPSSVSIGENGHSALINYTNVSIIHMYVHTLGTRNNRVIFQSSDTTRFRQITNTDKSSLYGYQLSMPRETPPDILNKRIINDLNTAFQLHADSQIVETDCHVIVDSDAPVKQGAALSQLDNDSVQIHEYRIGDFISLLNFSVVWTPDQPIYIDECTLEGKIKTPHYRDLQRDPERLKAVLSHYGLTVRKEKRPILMYVLTDVSQENAR